jgi:GTP-binding protein
VPVGTIVRELERQDPAAEEAVNMKVYQALQKQRRKEQNLEEEARRRREKEKALLPPEEEDEPEPDEEEEADIHTREIEEEEEAEEDQDPRRHKWLLYPGMSKTDMKSAEFPKLPTRQRHYHQPPAPINLDLSRPTEQPILLATGGLGGLGNPHFTSRAHPRPIFATRGDEAVTMKIELELKLLADVGLVGLPNAGKSTLLRALTNSRTRVGNWAFTTLQPNIGTVVLDKYSGRPAVAATNRRNPDGSEDLERRTRFTVADIPGLIEGAHLDRGLGIAFLRHVERAGVLAFVIDLGAGNAVKALNALWHEVGLYARMREEEEHDRGVDSNIDWSLDPQSSTTSHTAVQLLNAEAQASGKAPAALDIAGKPWFVVATKADLPETQENFRELKTYLDKITRGEKPHPSGVEDAWTQNCAAIPVSAINGQGVDRITHWTVGLLDG